MNVKAKITTGIAAALVMAVVSANAIPTYFVLDGSTAATSSGKTPTTFWYKAETGTPAKEEGSADATGMFTTAFGGDENNGYWALVTWGSNPQPEITEVLLKAANEVLRWDEDDLFAFNNGSYDGLKLVQNVIVNDNKKNEKKAKATFQSNFQGTSHIQLNGGPSTHVPDGGATLALLGLGVLGLGALRRKIG